MKIEKTPTEFTENFNKLSTLLTELIQSNDNYNETSSLLFAVTGSLELNISTHFPVVDPVEKNRLKKLYIEEDENLIDQLICSYNFMSITMNYESFGHEIVTGFNDKKFDLILKKEKLNKKVALRPEICVYREMQKDVEHFLQTCCQPKMFYLLFTKIVECFNFKTDSDDVQELFRTINDCLRNIELILNNIGRFESHNLPKYSIYYRDFIVTIENNLSSLKYGLNNLKHNLIKKRDTIQIRSNNSCYLINTDENFINFTKSLIEYPSTKNLITLLQQQNYSTDTTNIFTLIEKIDNSEGNFLQILKSSLSEIHNRLTISTNITENCVKEFNCLFDWYNKTWQKYEELRKKKQAEDDSLYVTKTKCSEQNEDDLNQDEINRIFPNYVEKDFGDFIENDTLEKVDKLKDAGTGSVDVFGAEDHKFLCENFIYLMNQFMK